MDDDIKTLLSLNAQGREWKEAKVERTILQTVVPILSPVLKAWQRDDGAYAFLPGPTPYCLTIQSKQLLDIDAAKAAAVKKSKETTLQGF